MGLLLLIRWQRFATRNKVCSGKADGRHRSRRDRHHRLVQAHQVSPACCARIHPFSEICNTFQDHALIQVERMISVFIMRNKMK